MKKKGLGRGLEALLGADKPETAPQVVGGANSLPISQLIAGKYQPRTTFDEVALNELAASIKAQGLMQPIVVRQLSAQQYEIIAGERRFRAAQRAGLTDVPVMLREVDDQGALALALIENIQREDLNAIEEARALKRLADEFGLTHEEVAKAVGRSRSAVTNLLRLNDLAPQVQDKVLTKQLDMGHARALASLPALQQIMLAEKISQQGLTVRAAEALAAKATNDALPAAQKSANTAQNSAQKRDPDVARLEEELAETLGAYVSIKPSLSGGNKGAGEVVIRYASLDQLDGIVAKIKS
jgi:ParB family transcriptional regulator, chromosome partitioning protein